MKNRILALLLVAVAVLICGCSAKKDTCSVDGCSQEVYKNGLCADHYVDVALSEAAASSEDSSKSIDPAIAAVQEKYQEILRFVLMQLLKTAMEELSDLNFTTKTMTSEKSSMNVHLMPKRASLTALWNFVLDSVHLTR